MSVGRKWVRSKQLDYSIIVSARASSLGATLTPRALAVARLIDNLNLVGCRTGRSADRCPAREGRTDDADQQERPQRRSHAIKALLVSRALLVKIKRDVENQIRGLLKNLGLVIGRAKMDAFAARAAELIEDHPGLAAVVGPLLKVRAAIAQQIADFDRKAMRLARDDAQVMSCRSLLQRNYLIGSAVGPTVSGHR